MNSLGFSASPSVQSYFVNCWSTTSTFKLIEPQVLSMFWSVLIVRVIRMGMRYLKFMTVWTLRWKRRLIFTYRISYHPSSIIALLSNKRFTMTTLSLDTTAVPSNILLCWTRLGGLLNLKKQTRLMYWWLNQSRRQSYGDIIVF